MYVCAVVYFSYFHLFQKFYTNYIKTNKYHGSKILNLKVMELPL